MKRLVNTIIFIYLIFFSLSSLSATVDIQIEPSSNSFELGDVFNIEIIGEYLGPATLAGGGIDFFFNSNVINITSVNVNPAIADFSSSNGVIDNSNGIVDEIAFASFFGVSGNFTFASITAEAVGVGESLLTLVDSQSFIYPWTNYDFTVSVTGDIVTPVISNSNVQVVPIPAAFYLFLSSFIPLALKIRI